MFVNFAFALLDWGLTHRSEMAGINGQDNKYYGIISLSCICCPDARQLSSPLRLQK